LLLAAEISDLLLWLTVGTMLETMETVLDYFDFLDFWRRNSLKSISAKRYLAGRWASDLVSPSPVIEIC
jgi:hypothetical protein